MPNDTQLSAQAKLADIRLRVINREPVSADEYRSLLLDLRKSRDNTAAAARSASAAKRKANAQPKAVAELDLGKLFGNG